MDCDYGAGFMARRQCDNGGKCKRNSTAHSSQFQHPGDAMYIGTAYGSNAPEIWKDYDNMVFRGGNLSAEDYKYVGECCFFRTYLFCHNIDSPKGCNYLHADFPCLRFHSCFGVCPGTDCHHMHGQAPLTQAQRHAIFAANKLVHQKQKEMDRKLTRMVKDRGLDLSCEGAFRLCRNYASANVCWKKSCSFLHGEYPCEAFFVTRDCFYGPSCAYWHGPKPANEVQLRIIQKMRSRNGLSDPVVDCLADLDDDLVVLDQVTSSSEGTGSGRDSQNDPVSSQSSPPCENVESDQSGVFQTPPEKSSQRTSSRTSSNCSSVNKILSDKISAILARSPEGDVMEISDTAESPEFLKSATKGGDSKDACDSNNSADSCGEIDVVVHQSFELASEAVNDSRCEDLNRSFGSPNGELSEKINRILLEQSLEPVCDTETRDAPITDSALSQNSGNGESDKNGSSLSVSNVCGLICEQSQQKETQPISAEGTIYVDSHVSTSGNETSSGSLQTEHSDLVRLLGASVLGDFRAASVSPSCSHSSQSSSEGVSNTNFTISFESGKSKTICLNSAVVPEISSGKAKTNRFSDAPKTSGAAALGNTECPRTSALTVADKIKLLKPLGNVSFETSFLCQSRASPDIQLENSVVSVSSCCHSSPSVSSTSATSNAMEFHVDITYSDGSNKQINHSFDQSSSSAQLLPQLGDHPGISVAVKSGCQLSDERCLEFSSPSSSTSYNSQSPSNVSLPEDLSGDTVAIDEAPVSPSQPVTCLFPPISPTAVDNSFFDPASGKDLSTTAATSIQETRLPCSKQSYHQSAFQLSSTPSSVKSTSFWPLSSIMGEIDHDEFPSASETDNPKPSGGSSPHFLGNAQGGNLQQPVGYSPESPPLPSLPPPPQTTHSYPVGSGTFSNSGFVPFPSNPPIPPFMLFQQPPPPMIPGLSTAMYSMPPTFNPNLQQLSVNHSALPTHIPLFRVPAPPPRPPAYPPAELFHPPLPPPVPCAPDEPRRDKSASPCPPSTTVVTEPVSSVVGRVAPAEVDSIVSEADNSEVLDSVETYLTKRQLELSRSRAKPRFEAFKLPQLHSFRTPTSAQLCLNASMEMDGIPQPAKRGITALENTECHDSTSSSVAPGACSADGDTCTDSSDSSCLPSPNRRSGLGTSKAKHRKLDHALPLEPHNSSSTLTQMDGDECFHDPSPANSDPLSTAANGVDCAAISPLSDFDVIQVDPPACESPLLIVLSGDDDSSIESNPSSPTCNIDETCVNLRRTEGATGFDKANPGCAFVTDNPAVDPLQFLLQKLPNCKRSTVDRMVMNEKNSRNSNKPLNGNPAVAGTTSSKQPPKEANEVSGLQLKLAMIIAGTEKRHKQQQSYNPASASTSERGNESMQPAPAANRKSQSSRSSLDRQNAVSKATKGRELIDLDSRRKAHRRKIANVFARGAVAGLKFDGFKQLFDPEDEPALRALMSKTHGGGINRVSFSQSTKLDRVPNVYKCIKPGCPYPTSFYYDVIKDHEKRVHQIQKNPNEKWCAVCRITLPPPLMLHIMNTPNHVLLDKSPPCVATPHKCPVCLMSHCSKLAVAKHIIERHGNSADSEGSNVPWSASGPCSKCSVQHTSSYDEEKCKRTMIF